MDAPTSEPKRLVAPLAALAFVSLGLPDGLLGVAWPSMRVFFGVDLQALGGLLVATTAGYVASSFSSGRLLRQVNLGTVLAASCLLTASGLLGYAAASHWPVVLALGVVLGVGAGAIDAALNTYVATHHGARTLNWLHACFGIGAASGPLMMTAVLQRGSTWQRGYVIVGIAQIALATCFALTFRAWPRSDGFAPSADRSAGATMGETLRVPAAWLGMAVFVAYAGVEASIGAWTFTVLTVARHIGIVQAGLLASLYWGGITAGRLLAAIGGGVVPVDVLLTDRGVRRCPWGWTGVGRPVRGSHRSGPPAGRRRVWPHLSIADCGHAGASRAPARRQRRRLSDRRLCARTLSRARTGWRGRREIWRRSHRPADPPSRPCPSVVYHLLDRTAPALSAK